MGLLDPKPISAAAIAAQVANPDSVIGSQLTATIVGATDLRTGTAAIESSIFDTKAASARAALANRGSAMFTVATITDSIGEGQGATARTKRWMNRIIDSLSRAYPTPGVTGYAEYLPVYFESNTMGQPAALVGSPAKNSNFGPGGRSYRFVPGQSVTWTVTGVSHVDVMYVKSTSTGPMKTSVDGVSVDTFQTAAASNSDGHLRTIILPDTGTHTIKVEPETTFDIVVDGIITYRGSRTAGIRYIDGGHSGWTTTHQSNGGSGGTSLTEWMTTVAPSLVIIELGANDYGTGMALATFKTNLQTIITKVRNSGYSPDFLIVGMPERNGAGTYSWQDYITAMREVAEADAKVSFVDLSAQLAKVAGDTLGLWMDTVHPNDKGNTAMAGIIGGLVSNGLAVAPLSTGAGFTGETVRWIPAKQLDNAVGTPAMSVGAGTYTSLNYDPNTQEGALSWFPIPPGWTKATVELFWLNPSLASGNVFMRVQLQQQGVGALVDGAKVFDSSLELTAGTQYVLNRTTWATDVTVNPAKLAMVYVIRAAADPKDTLDADIGVVGVKLTRTA